MPVPNKRYACRRVARCRAALSRTTSRFDFAIDVSGDQAALLDKYNAEDRYVGSLVGVQYAKAFRSRSPLLVESPEVF